MSRTRDEWLALHTSTGFGIAPVGSGYAVSIRMALLKDLQRSVRLLLSPDEADALADSLKHYAQKARNSPIVWERPDDLAPVSKRKVRGSHE